MTPNRYLPAPGMGHGTECFPIHTADRRSPCQSIAAPPGELSVLVTTFTFFKALHSFFSSAVNASVAVLTLGITINKSRSRCDLKPAILMTEGGWLSAGRAYAVLKRWTKG